MTNPDFIKAEELAKNRQFSEALEYYNLAVTSEAQNPVYVSQRAVCFFHLKKLELALADMNSAVNLDPNYSYRYASRAYIRDAMKDVKGAIEDYQKAVELDPSDAVSYNNLGLLEEKLGYIESSKKNFKKADDLAKLLEGTGVVTEKELIESEGPQPENIQKQIDVEKEVSEASSFSQEIKNVFTKKDVFKEFLTFVKRGFKKS